MKALFDIGDKVLVTKCGELGGENRYRWIPEMDSYDGCVSTITAVDDPGEDETEYGYDIDGGEGYGFQEQWLTKIN